MSASGEDEPRRSGGGGGIVSGTRPSCAAMAAWKIQAGVIGPDSSTDLAMSVNCLAYVTGPTVAALSLPLKFMGITWNYAPNNGFPQRQEIHGGQRLVKVKKTRTEWVTAEAQGLNKHSITALGARGRSPKSRRGSVWTAGSRSHRFTPTRLSRHSATCS